LVYSISLPYPALLSPSHKLLYSEDDRVYSWDPRVSDAEAG